MLTGLRASDAAILMRLCGADQKAFLRVGALLQAKVSLTEAALAELMGTERGKAILLDRRLKTATPATFGDLLDEHQLAADLVCLDGDQVEAGWRVIALADEVGNPLLAAAQGDADPQAGTGAALALRMATLSPALRAPVEGLLQANGDEARAAALEQLRYAGAPLEVIGQLMPLLLADAAELVRERAVGLLVGAGAHVSVIDLVRALQREDLKALERIAPALPGLPPIQRDLCCTALMAAIGRGTVHQTVVDACTHLAEHLSSHIILDRLVELLLPGPVNLVDFVRALQTHAATRIADILARALGRSADADRHIIILLAGPGSRGEDRLIDRGVDLLISRESEPLERLALATALTRLAGPEDLGRRVVARGMDLAKSYDTSVYWLLSELARDGHLDTATSTDLARLLRRLLREAPGPHVAAILDYQVVALLKAGAEDRRTLVEPTAEALIRFRDDRTRDLVHHTLLSLGEAAIEPVWNLIAEQGEAEVRILGIRLLPDLLERAGRADAGAVHRLCDHTRRVEPGPAFDQERGEVLAAAARLAVGLGDGDLSRQVDDLLVQAGDCAATGLGWIASGPACDPVRRSAIVDQLLGGITEELPDTPLVSTVDEVSEAATFVIDTQLGRHTERVPILLLALERIGASPHLPQPILRHLVDRLCAQWKRVSAWEIVWGPGNIVELGRVLGSLATRDHVPLNLRVRICEALLPRISQLGVARSLAEIVAAAEPGYLSDLAGRAAARLLALVARGQFADDETEDLADTLTVFLSITDLGSEGAQLHRRLAAQLGQMKTRIPQRARARLRAALPHMEAALKERLDWV